jgi:hypothetical protein
MVAVVVVTHELTRALKTESALPPARPDGRRWSPSAIITSPTARRGTRSQVTRERQPNKIIWVASGAAGALICTLRHLRCLTRLVRIVSHLRGFKFYRFRRVQDGVVRVRSAGRLPWSGPDHARLSRRLKDPGFAGAAVVMPGQSDALRRCDRWRRSERRRFAPIVIPIRLQLHPRSGPEAVPARGPRAHTQRHRRQKPIPRVLRSARWLL